jgi:hypothetical protein
VKLIKLYADDPMYLPVYVPSTKIRSITPGQPNGRMCAVNLDGQDEHDLRRHYKGTINDLQRELEATVPAQPRKKKRKKK